MIDNTMFWLAKAVSYKWVLTEEYKSIIYTFCLHISILNYMPKDTDTNMYKLGGGNSTIFTHFDDQIFQMGWFNHQPVSVSECRQYALLRPTRSEAPSRISACCARRRLCVLLRGTVWLVVKILHTDWKPKLNLIYKVFLVKEGEIFLNPKFLFWVEASLDVEGDVYSL